MLGYLISPVLQIEDTDGKPLVGGRIVVYRHGTTEPYITYRDFEGTHNPAEVILDSKGMCILIAEEGYSYDVYCRDRNYVEQWSRIGISIGLGGTSIISRDGTITVHSEGGVVDLGVSDNDVSVFTGAGTERTTDGTFAVTKTASSGPGLALNGNRVQVKRSGWFHVETTWYAQANSTENGYRTLELVTTGSRTKLTLDLTVSSEQWRILANDYYLHEDDYIDFTLSGMGNDGAVRSWLQNVSIHRLTNIVGNPPDRVRPDWAVTDPNSPAYIFNKPNLATVATTGEYDDLLGKPDLSIYAEKVEGATAGNLAALDSEGNLVDSGEAAANIVHDANYVHTDENFTSDEKTKLAGIEAGAEVNVQADWTEQDSTKDSYIQNKPNLATVATTGNYDDLNGKPHVPTVSGDGTSISSIDGLPIYADRATNDGSGNNILATYAKESAMSGKQNVLSAGNNISISNSNVINVKNEGSTSTGNSVALGYRCSAFGRWAFAHGYNTLASGANSYSHAEGSTTSAFGNNSHAEGNRTYAANDNAHSEGSGTSAFNGGAHAEGFSTLTMGTYSHAEGRNTVTSAQGSHAEGYRTSALNENAHSEGSTNVSYGNASHTEGRQNLTSGYGSHAEGYLTSAVNDQAHSEGVSTYVLGNGAHAEGHQTSAMAQRSHSEGYGTLASAGWSHAEGRNTIASGSYQHVEGQYNAPNTTDYWHVGNGTSDSNRSNLIGAYGNTVYVNGTLDLSGSNVNDSISTLNRFMFDSLTPSGEQAVLMIDTGNWVTKNDQYSGYVKKYDRIFVGDIRNPTVGNTRLCGIKGPNNEAVGIVDWKGNISRACWNNENSIIRNYISSWPSTVPADSITATRLFSENLFLTNVSQIPTNFIEVFSGASKTKQRCFQGCSRLTGDITPYLAAFSADPDTTTNAIFGGCTSVDNYDTLSAQFPNMFANPS